MPDDFADSLTDLTKPLGSVAPTPDPGDANGGSIEELGDADIFKVQLEAGATYIFDLEGLQTDAGTLFDPFLTLFDSTGALVTGTVSSFPGGDDDSGDGLNSQLIFTPTTSGTYLIEASAFADAFVGSYRLTATTSPAITSDGGGTSATVTRAENDAAVTTVIAAFSASAGDLHTPATAVTYSIVGGTDAADFIIDPTTGVLSFVSAPNFEAPGNSDLNNSYVVDVRATDNGNPVLIDTQTITVNVADVPSATITGTNANDIISPTQTVAGQPLPGAEDDTIFGLDGADDMDGGAGADHLEGGRGNDAYRVDTSSDVIVENAAEGEDTVVTSTISFSLKNTNLENIVLKGSLDLNAKGNGAENYLQGNEGDNILYSVGGDDEMVGGVGADTFAFGDGDGNDAVDDFENDIDQIDLTRVADVDSFSDLNLDTALGGVMVHYGTGDIFIQDATKAQLDGDDFIFA